MADAAGGGRLLLQKSKLKKTFKYKFTSKNFDSVIRRLRLFFANNFETLIFFPNCVYPDINGDKYRRSRA